MKCLFFVLLHFFVSTHFDANNLQGRIRFMTHLLAHRNLLWDILRLPSSCRAALGLYVILTLWQARGHEPGTIRIAAAYRSSLCYALRHRNVFLISAAVFIGFCIYNDIPYSHFPLVCYFHFQADFCWSLSSSVSNYLTFCWKSVVSFIYGCKDVLWHTLRICAGTFPWHVVCMHQKCHINEK